MYRILPVLGDVGLGILVSIACMQWYGVNDSLLILWGVVWAFLPDVDALAEIRKKGYVAASKENPHDHREALHVPITWLLATGVMWWGMGVWGAIAFLAILLHFLHDSVLTGWGVAWMAPFSSTRYKFFVDEENRESLACKDWIRSWNPQELRVAIVAYGDEKWIEHLYLRPTPPSVVEYSLFSFSILVLLWHFSQR